MTTVNIKRSATGRGFIMAIQEPGLGALHTKAQNAHELGLAVEHYYAGHNSSAGHNETDCPFCRDCEQDIIEERGAK
jgi:hypothetical protein